jgi:ATP-dependent helicase/nuclease subunit A
MTRAREKLILTGSVKTISQEERVNYSTRTGANRFLDWILPCVNQDREEKYFQKQYIPRSKVLADYAKKQAEKQMDLQALEGMLTAAVPDREWQEKQESYHFQYPYQEAVTQKVKLSVSEIKKMAMYQQGLEEEEVHAFVANVDQGSGGARRGTVIHKLMELLDFQGIDSRDKMKEELEGLMQLPVFSEEDREIKGMQQVIDFYDSELFHRMQAADRKGRLHREAQFTVGIPANQLNPASGNTDMVVVQGIVDAYFYEGEDIILMDYKTDAVKEPQTLIQRYKAQLDCYGDTLERLTGCKVKEKLIYSFALNRVIAL